MSLISIRVNRLRGYLSNRQVTLDETPGRDISEVKKHQTPEVVRRCVASVVNKGDKTTKVDPSKEEKSKAFAICWDSHNKGELSKGLSGTRKSQYKALLKNK